MKSKSFNGQAEKLKENIEAVSEKSKSNIREIIDACAKQVEQAIDENKKFIESLEKQVLAKDFIDTTVLSETKKAFGTSIELSEKAIDEIIDMQTEQLQSAIDYNVKLADSLKRLEASDGRNLTEVMSLIRKNLEESSSRSIGNSRKMVDIYNRHLNLALNFNERFSKNINNQLQLLGKVQNKNAEMFSDWATHWWKQASKEETVA